MTTLPKNQLTAEESARFTELRAVVAKGMAAFVEVGLALAEISDKRLYRATHSTFEAFCQEEYKKSARQIYNWMRGAEAVKGLAEENPDLRNTVSQMNARQAAEVSKVPPTKRAKVVESAQKQAESEGRQMTAADVKQAAECEVCPPESPRIRTADEILADQVAAAKATLSPIANDPEFDGATAEFRAHVVKKWHDWLDRNWSVKELPIVRRVVAGEIKRA